MITSPSKEQVRAYIHMRIGAKTPPAPGQQIRDQLGWKFQPDQPPVIRCIAEPSRGRD
jgi:hypothetical protein